MYEIKKKLAKCRIFAIQPLLLARKPVVESTAQYTIRLDIYQSSLCVDGETAFFSSIFGEHSLAWIGW